MLLNLLVAYPYMQKSVINLLDSEKENIRFLLDSGAFTSWKLGKKISVSEYCEFIISLPFKPWRYFTLDVIGDPKKSHENYTEMLARGFNPIPIFTRGESLEMIDEYYKTSDVLGLGGLVGTKGNKGFVKAVMKKVNDRKVHWLGFTNDVFARHFKPYSFDSSSWESGAQYGQLKIYDNIGNGYVIKKSMFSSRPCSKLSLLLAEYGVGAKDLSVNQNWAGGVSLSRSLGAKSACRQQIIYERIGVNSFSAATTGQAITLLLEGNKFWRNKNEINSGVIRGNGLSDSVVLRKKNLEAQCN